MVLQNTSVDQIGNDPFYAKIFLCVTLTLFIILTLFYYLSNPLLIYHFIGLRSIMFSLFVIFFFISLIVIYNLYFNQNDAYYNTKSMFQFMALFGNQYIYILFVSLFSFYIFMKFFRYFQNEPQITGTLMKGIFYTTITLLLLFSLLNFTNLFFKKNSKNNKFPLENLFNVIKNLTNYLGCFISDTINYIQNDIQNTNIFSIYLLISFIGIIFVSYVIPRIMIYILLYDGKQLLNSPIYLNKSHYLTSYSDLNKEIINSNIFKYLSQMLYDTYNSFVSNQESYINLDDPALSYELNEKLKNLKDEFDPKFLEKILNENPDMIDNIEKIMNDPDFLSEYIKSISPYQGEYIEKIMDYIYNLNTVTIDKTFDELLRPRISYNYNNENKSNYNYCISCWVFIDNYDGNKNESLDSDKTLIKFGNKLNAKYNPYSKQIKVEVKSCMSEFINDNISNNEEKKRDSKCRSKIAFRSKDVLLQKWNHIVFNYDSGTLDIFINNKIVSSTPNISPLYFDDSIIVGDNEGVEGAICNVMYFSNILSKSNINKIYKYFYTSTPPIL